MRLCFPVGCFAVGAFLYWRYPLLYVGFTWWVCFLTPWVRRLIDYQSGWVDPSPVLLAPFLVLLVTFVTFVRHLPKSYHQGGLPFVLACAGVFYSFFVGLIKNLPSAAILSLLGWLTPILFGLHLFVNWREYPSYRKNIQRTFLWGVLITGAYGLLQFMVVPPWDQYWMLQSEIDSIGRPEPFQIRVFSTMNAPGPFAVVMMAGLLLLFHSQGALLFPASAFGYLSFLLSQVRAAWLGWTVGLLTLITSLKQHLQIRLIITIMVIVLSVLPLTTIEPFSETISSRLQSFTTKDESYKARSAGYAELFSLALSELPGKGLGFVIKNDSIGAYDSGIMAIFFSMGWLGAIPYLGAIFLLLFSVFQSSEGSFDPFMSAARAISLSVFVQIGLGTVTSSLSGVVFWGFLGMAMAARKYYHR